MSQQSSAPVFGSDPRIGLRISLQPSGPSEARRPRRAEGSKGRRPAGLGGPKGQRPEGFGEPKSSESRCGFGGERCSPPTPQSRASSGHSLSFSQSPGRLRDGPVPGRTGPRTGPGTDRPRNRPPDRSRDRRESRVQRTRALPEIIGDG